MTRDPIARGPKGTGLRTTSIAAACAAVFACFACTGRPAELAVNGRSNAQPSITASGRFVAVTWGAADADGATDVYVATSRDGGRTLGTPTRVNDAATVASLSGEQPPHVALIPRAGRDPAIVVVWTAKGATGTRLLSAQSDDGGKSFARPTEVPGTDAPGNRGWHAVTTDRDGHVVAVWLDHRELAQGSASGAGASASGHNHAAHGAQQTDGAARAQRSKLFFASLDGEATAQALTGGVCYCCKTAIATGADGSVYAAWRHVYTGNVRDIAFTVSRDEGRTFAEPVRVSEDEWVLDGCPENGPAIAIDARNRVHVVWPTLVAGSTPDSEPTMALFYAVSANGEQFTPRRQIPTEGVPRHVQIALTARGDVVVAWDEQANDERRVALARATADSGGSTVFTRQAMGDVTASYPVIATTPDGIVAAWTSGRAESIVRVERVPD